MPEMETLRCQAGHDFKRPRTRGRKPQWCSEHKPVQQAKAKAPEAREKALSKARAVRQEKQRESQSQIDRQVEEILASPINEELKRKLQYAHANAARPLMGEVRADLIKQAMKRRVSYTGP